MKLFTQQAEIQPTEMTTATEISVKPEIQDRSVQFNLIVVFHILCRMKRIPLHLFTAKLRSSEIRSVKINVRNRNEILFQAQAKTKREKRFQKWFALCRYTPYTIRTRKLVLVKNSVENDFANCSLVLDLFRHDQTKHSKPFLFWFLWNGFLHCWQSFLLINSKNHRKLEGMLIHTQIEYYTHLFWDNLFLLNSKSMQFQRSCRRCNFFNDKLVCAVWFQLEKWVGIFVYFSQYIYLYCAFSIKQ